MLNSNEKAYEYYRMINPIEHAKTREEAKKYKDILYIRVLGFNKKGQNYLKQIKKDINIPIITKVSDSNNERLLLEQKVTNIFSLILDNDSITKEEYQSFPIIKD